MKKHKIPSFKLLILFEDDDYIVVNKPAFLSSLEDRQMDINLLRMARDYHPDAQLCHRLDKDTSGVMIIAKNPSSYRAMAIHFENRHPAFLFLRIVFHRSQYIR